MRYSKTLKEMQKEWYEKLKESGFKDIEEFNKQDRPLKEWHSFKYVSQRSQFTQSGSFEYRREIDEFVHHESFHEACTFMVSHGNSKRKYTAENVKQIWEHHIDGKTERSIAGLMKLSKTCVHQVLDRMKQWMRLR